MTTPRISIFLHFLGAALLAAAFVLTLNAQVPDNSQQPSPTIRVSTHLVLVDVVVTDKQGKAVTGLHPEDFVVEENGKAQKITSLVSPAENASAATPPL